MSSVYGQTGETAKDQYPETVKPNKALSMRILKGHRSSRCSPVVCYEAAGSKLWDFRNLLCIVERVFRVLIEMGSKGRIPPALVRRPLPGPALLHHPDLLGAGIYPPLGHMPLEVLTPPELMEQKLATQDIEMQRLATENQRLAATHSALRQELVGAQQELQRLHGHMDAMKAEQEGQMRILMDKINKMEVDLQAAERVKQELQQAHTEAQSLVAARQDLTTRALQLTQDVQRARTDSQQIHIFVSELEGLRQEYEHCRATYEYEKKIKKELLESLQVMERNYISMSREVEKLRAELASTDRRNGGPYADAAGYKENDALGDHSVRQNSYEDGYGASRAWGGQASVTSYGAGAPGSATGRVGYEAGRDSLGYDMARGTAYDTSRGGPGYDSSKGPTGYEVSQRGGPGYDAERGGSGYDASKGSYGYGAPRGYDAVPSRGLSGGHSTHASGNAAAYGPSGTPSGLGYDDTQRGSNAARR